MVGSLFFFFFHEEKKKKSTTGYREMFCGGVGARRWFVLEENRWKNPARWVDDAL